MKRLFFLLNLLLPLSLLAQLDVLRPGMELDEVRAKFPDLVRDYGSMSSWASGEGKMLDIAGRVTYVVQCDTVKRYEFISDPAYGACPDYPKADSVDAMKLLSAARTLIGHYTDIYGTPVEKNNQSFLSPTGVQSEVKIVYAHWKNANDEIEVKLTRPGIEIYPQMNAEPRNSKSFGNCEYTLTVRAFGNSLRMRSEFGMGMTAEQFRKWQPDLASQVQDHPDCWMRDDTTGGLRAHWRFQFKDQKLIGYFYDAYTGPDYGQASELAYAAVLSKADKLKAEAVKQFGNPYKDSTNVSKKYNAPKKPGLYYSRVDYLAQWKPGNNFLMIRLNERGGGKQGPPVFHLEVYFGKRD